MEWLWLRLGLRLAFLELYQVLAAKSNTKKHSHLSEGHPKMTQRKPDMILNDHEVVQQ